MPASFSHPLRRAAAWRLPRWLWLVLAGPVAFAALGLSVWAWGNGYEELGLAASQFDQLGPRTLGILAFYASYPVQIGAGRGSPAGSGATLRGPGARPASSSPSSPSPSRPCASSTS